MLRFVAKTEHFTKLDTDLERLATRVETYLQENKFEVGFSKDPTEPASWFFIQASKGGALRTAAGARRSTDITIRGKPGDFEVTIGTGEWGKNIVTSVPLFIVPVVGIGATIAKLYTAKKFEDNLWKFIRDQSRYLAGSAQSSTAGQATMQDSRAYDCDYVEGYPGWNSQVRGGKLVLIREKGGKNMVVFKADEKEIVIPAENIEGINIISRKKGLREHDLMIELSLRTTSGRLSKPVFNVNDSIIKGVVAGIDEIVGEDKGLRSIEQARVTSDSKYCANCGAQIAKDAKFCSACGLKQS
jgi:ribosomal protein L40E